MVEHFFHFFFVAAFKKKKTLKTGPWDARPLTIDGLIAKITHSFRGVRRKEIAFFVKVFSIQFSPISPVWLSLELLYQVIDEGFHFFIIGLVYKK